MVNPDDGKREMVLAKLKDLIAKPLAHTHARVYLFGSWARGTERRTSDIDIAIDHDGTVTRELFMHIRELIEESDIPYRVDIIDLTKAGTILAEKVKQEGIAWNA